MQVQWRALSLAVNKPLKASIPIRAPLVGEAAAEVEMPAGNSSPTTEPQCWRDEGKTAAIYMKTATHQTTAQRGRNSPSHSNAYRRISSQGFFLLSYKQRQEERNGDHSKTQLSCFRFIFPQGTIVKISNPLRIKQSRSGFHFPITVISQKGDQKHISENQDGN